MRSSFAASPYDLTRDDAYVAWRSQKLAQHPRSLAEITVRLRDPARLRPIERNQLLAAIARCNMVAFKITPGDEDPMPMLLALGEQLGLHNTDRNLCAEDIGITPITVRDTGTDKAYIPYTNRPLSWHTDGYYNAPERSIRAWLLYCAADAAAGGENELLDHEIAYIRLRDQNSDYIRALMAPDAFTIPANDEGGAQIRPDTSGPVFSVDDNTGALHMRYSARQRNVIWKDDATTRAAAAALTALFSAGDALIFRHRLAPGEGILSNNVLHRREGFRDDPATGHKRLVYRARYYDRIAAA
jgi:alpha-ketoglutarate-dependent taurine dioxygenase